jgi:trehalose-6-phosphatase
LKYLFSPSNDDLLGIYAGSNVLLALDYDGTLAPLVREPERATMRLSTRLLLKRAIKLSAYHGRKPRCEFRCSGRTAQGLGLRARAGAVRL